jgi:hypothetical protein
LVVVTVPDNAGRWIATLGAGVGGGGLGDWIGARIEEVTQVEGLKEIGAVVGFWGAVRIFNRLSRPAEQMRCARSRSERATGRVSVCRSLTGRSKGGSYRTPADRAASQT